MLFGHDATVGGDMCVLVRTTAVAGRDPRCLGCYKRHSRANTDLRESVTTVHVLRINRSSLPSVPAELYQYESPANSYYRSCVGVNVQGGRLLVWLKGFRADYSSALGAAATPHALLLAAPIDCGSRFLNI